MKYIVITEDRRDIVAADKLEIKEGDLYFFIEDDMEEFLVKIFNRNKWDSVQPLN